MAYTSILDLELDDRYFIHQETEDNMFHNYVEEMDQTLISFSGALIARKYDWDRKETVSQFSFTDKTFRRLFAIDLLSFFEVDHALELLYRDKYRMNECKTFANVVRFDDNIRYDINSLTYKARLEFLIYMLLKQGL